MLLAPVVWILTVVIAYFFAAKTWWFPPPINAARLSPTTRSSCARWSSPESSSFSRNLRSAGSSSVSATTAAAPATTHGNNNLETVWTSATALLFLGLVLMGTKIWAGVHFDQPPADAIPIEVLGKQFAWSFRYPGPDGKFGHTDLKLVNDSGGNPFGLDEKDPAAKDDIVSASLKVPAGKPIKLIMHSRDVIHNFFVRELRMKQDIVPGMEIPLAFPGRHASASMKSRAPSYAAWAISRCAPPCR